MKFAIVDCQGFFSDPKKFVLKELAVCSEQGVVNYVFRPIKPYHELNREEKKEVYFLEQNHHGLRYSGGVFNAVEDLPVILFQHLKDVDRVYVKGVLKHEFIKNVCNVIFKFTPKIVNIEDLYFVPKLQPIIDKTYCNFHFTNQFICSKQNATSLYFCIKSFLPE